MNILIVTSLFHPEIAATSKRMTHLAEGLKEKKHDVNIITAFPYYSTSKNLGRYKGKWIVKDQYKGIPLIRTYTYSHREYGNIFKRLLSFLSFMISSIYGSFKVKGKVDVVITISPPFFSLFSGYVISWIKKASLILDIQDIYPETVIALGFLKNTIAISLLEWLEGLFYRKACGMVAISDGFRQDFISKGANSQRVEVVHNWVDIELFKSRDGKDLRREYNLDSKFVVMFLGTLGFAQGLENVIEAARLLTDYRNEIEIVFLGEGVKRERLKTIIKKYGLYNFTFISPKPNFEIPKFLSLADSYLVYLRKNNLFKITIPSKIYEYMAMGKPIILGVKGEALRLIEEGKCGIGVEPESPEDLARAILELFKNKEIATRMGENGREFVVTNFSKGKMVSKYIDFIERYGLFS